MAVNGLNGGASPLDRFQQIRDLAKKKLDGDDNRTRLADLLKQKQAEMGAIGGRAGLAAGNARAAAPARKFEMPAAGDATNASAAAGLGGISAYGRGGAAEKPKAGPGLGRYIDLTA